MPRPSPIFDLLPQDHVQDLLGSPSSIDYLINFIQQENLGNSTFEEHTEAGNSINQSVASKHDISLLRHDKDIKPCSTIDDFSQKIETLKDKIKTIRKKSHNDSSLPSLKNRKLRNKYSAQISRIRSKIISLEKDLEIEQLKESINALKKKSNELSEENRKLRCENAQLKEMQADSTMIFSAQMITPFKRTQEQFNPLVDCTVETEYTAQGIAVKRKKLD